MGEEFYKKTSIFMFVGFLIVSLMMNKSCNSERNAIRINELMNDTLSISYNENGHQNASIVILELESEKQFLELKSKDSTILWLQKSIEEYKGKLNTAVVVSGGTISSDYTETIIYDVDTVYLGSDIYLYPKYETTWDNEWERGVIKASKDSIFRDIKVINKYEITLGRVSNGWFKKKEYRVNVVNLNPNTYTEELRSFDLKEKPKRLNVGLQVGYGVSLPYMRPTMYVGFGVNVKVLGVK